MKQNVIFNFICLIISMLQKQKVFSSPKIQRQQLTRSSSGASQQLSMQEEKKRKFLIKESIYLIYYLLRIGLTVAVIITLLQNFITKLSSTPQFTRMQENIALWKQDIITNITTVNSYNCPQGYETYTSYEWPGTKKGCYCYTQIDQWDYIKILQGQCSQIATSAGCQTVPKMPAVPFLFWKKDQLICVKRVKGLNFFTDLGTSSINAIECSNGKDYQFSIPLQLNVTLCPLTDLTNTSLLSYQLPQINFSYQRETSYPIIAIKMTQYEFCSDYNKENISPYKQRSSNYNLELITREYCNGIDPRVVVVDEQGENQLFANNPRINQITTQLPAYPQPMADYKYKLGFVRYPEWTYSCRQSEEFRLSNVQRQLNLQDISSYTITSISIATAFIAITGGLLTIFFIYRKSTQIYYKHQQQVLYDSIPQLQKKKPNLYQKLHKKFITELIIFLIQLLAALAVLIIVAVLFVKVQDQFLWYKQARMCTSQVMSEWIDLGYVKYFDLQQTNLLLSIILVLSLLIIDTAMFLWRNFKGDLKKQDYDQQATNIFDDDIKHSENHQHNQDNLQFPSLNKKIELHELKYGHIVRNANDSENQINLTEENFIEVDHLPQGRIVRQKRQNRSRAKQRSQKSQGTQEQWDI